MRPVFRSAAALCLGLAPLLAHAATIDIPDRDPAALAAAIRDANTRPGLDRIRLAAGGLYPFSQAPASGPLIPVITDDLDIEGRGAELRRYVDGRFALIEVAPGANVRLADLTLAEGTDGALHNFGQLVLDRVRVLDSTASHTPAIVLNHGTLQLRACEIAFNTLPASSRDAGTILNYGRVTLEASSIHDNIAHRRYPSLAAAGAMLNLGDAVVRELRTENNQVDPDPGALAFDGILNLGNGRVSGSAGAGQVRETARPPQLAGSL